MRKARSTLLAIALVTAAAAAHGQLGFITGNFDKLKNVFDATRDIKEPEEVKLGGELASLLLGAAPLVSNQIQQQYVNRLGLWLALHSERPNLPWKFGIIETSDVNAFSTPGGYVLISRGLFEQARNEAELAGVLAHEIAHVVGKHHLKAIQKGKGSSALAGFGKSAVGGGIAGDVAGKLVDSFRDVLISGLDKNDEYDADRMAVVIAARSGFSPYGLVGVLQTMSAAPKDGGYALLYATHPAPLDRIERLDKAMGTRLDDVPGLVDDLPAFARVQSGQVAVIPAQVQVPVAQPKAPPRARSPRPRRR
jgi:predicted Zn-dependent protease